MLVQNYPWFHLLFSFVSCTYYHTPEQRKTLNCCKGKVELQHIWLSMWWSTFYGLVGFWLVKHREQCSGQTSRWSVSVGLSLSLLKCKSVFFFSFFFWDLYSWVVYKSRDELCVLHVYMIHAYMQSVNNLACKPCMTVKLVRSMTKVYFQYFFSMSLMIFFLNPDLC